MKHKSRSIGATKTTLMARAALMGCLIVVSSQAMAFEDNELNNFVNSKCVEHLSAKSGFASYAPAICACMTDELAKSWSSKDVQRAQKIKAMLDDDDEIGSEDREFFNKYVESVGSETMAKVCYRRVMSRNK